MLHHLYSQLSIAALLLICGLAVWKGGPAERAGATAILATWTLSLLASIAPIPQVGDHDVPAAVYLTSDAILAAALLILAVRYSNWWLGAAMALQAAGLSLHAAFFAADKSELSHAYQNLYVLGKNLTSVAMLLVLLAATVAGIFKRRRAASARLRAEMAGQAIV